MAHTPTDLSHAPEGEDAKTVQELLRHADSLVTMNLYAQAVTEVKRPAQSPLVGMLLDENAAKQRTVLMGAKRTFEKTIQASKLLILLASPTGFEPVLSP